MVNLSTDIEGVIKARASPVTEAGIFGNSY
jgi:hypothetical protein